MTGDQIRAKHREHLFPATINYYAEPVAVDRAQGAWVWDADGREYLDFFGGILTVSLGHCEPRVTAAIKAQADKLQHISTLYPTEPVVRLAERLSALAPGGPMQSFFVGTGTEADETAVMLAMCHTGHPEIIALRNGYSGRSMLAQALTAHSNWRVLPTQIAAVKHAHAPYCYRCDFGLTYPSCDLRCARDLERLIQTTTIGAVAGILVEPVQGVGGFMVPPPDYCKLAAEIVRRYGGLFIADEVQTGFGRTGKHLWGIQHFGVDPDIMTMAKGIANGLPAANCMARPHIAKSIPRLTISTFGANPLPMAAANAVLDVIAEDDIPARAERLGNLLHEGLLEIQRRFPHACGDVRGLGLMQAIEIVKDEVAGDRTPDVELTARVFEAARGRGLLLGKGGRFGNVPRIAPPMLIAADEIRRGLALFAEALEAAGAR